MFQVGKEDEYGQEDRVPWFPCLTEDHLAELPEQLLLILLDDQKQGNVQLMVYGQRERFVLAPVVRRVPAFTTLVEVDGADPQRLRVRD
jgi:hypothetical protein